MEENININVRVLHDFTVDVFTRLGVPLEDARISADVLIKSDQRGIGSHGLQRLKRYFNDLRAGVIKPVTNWEIVKETPNTLLVSGADGMGQVVSYHTMNLVINKAKKNNVAFAAVRDSNHYGIAGYYSLMALEHDLIGFSVTNTAPLVVPTFGKNMMLGTNPIAIAVPTGKEKPFVLDMATSTVPRGKLEVYNREGKEIPLTWATDELGNASSDAARVLKNMLGKIGGGLLPLGGAGEENSGYKGYGLCLAVDIFSGVIADSAFGINLYPEPGAPAKVSHFFGAVNINAFIDIDRFKNNMDEYIRQIKESDKAAGQDRIYIHGEKEWELYEQQMEEVGIYYKVVEELRSIGKDVGVEAAF